MNAQYEVVKVAIFYQNQRREVFLHIIKPQGKNNVYFLKDFYGWSIDDSHAESDAIEGYNEGRFTIVEI